MTEIQGDPKLHFEVPIVLLGEMDGALMSGSPEKSPPPAWTPKTLGILSAFWMGVGILGGTADYLARVSNPESAGWVQSVTLPLLMGLLWIPTTLVIYRASLTFPPASFHPRPRLHAAEAILHGVGSLTVGFLLNGAFYSILALFGLLPPGDILEVTMETGLRFLHLNAGVYWAIVGAAHLPGILASRNRALVRAAEFEAFEETLTVRSGNQSIVVRVSDIRWIEGAGDYVRLHLGLANHLHSERLKRLETRLDPHRFVRVHRSAIVNVEAVRKLRHLGHGDYEAVLEDGSSVRVSRTRRSQLTELLEKREVGDAPTSQE